MPREIIPIGLLMGNLLKNYAGVFSNELRHLDISRYQYTLVLIDEHPGINQQGLAELLGTDKVSVGRMLDYLSEKGCIERKQNPDDRRKHLLLLTGNGKKILKEVLEAVAHANEVIFNGFSHKEKLQFQEMMKRMNTNLEALPKDIFHIHYYKDQ